MSKSRRNVVDPAHIIDTYGADTARLFMLSDSPPSRDLEWTDAGIEGAWRYVNRLWRLVTDPDSAVAPRGADRPPTLSGEAENTLRAVHKTIAAVTGDLEGFRFNRAVARIRELSNTLAADGGDGGDGAWVRRFGLEVAVRLIGPIMPHLAEELWSMLGHEELLATVAWPEADRTYLAEETVTIAVQVNGKLRGTIDLPVDAAKEDAEALALALENVQRATNGAPPRKIIVVPNKVINVVV